MIAYAKVLPQTRSNCRRVTLLPANAFTEFAETKVFIELKIQTKLVVCRVILVVSSCITNLDLIEQCSDTNRKSIKTVAAFVNIQFLSPQVIVCQGYFKVIANVNL